MKKVLHSEGNYSYCGIWVNKKKKKVKKIKALHKIYLDFSFFGGGLFFAKP